MKKIKFKNEKYLYMIEAIANYEKENFKKLAFKEKIQPIIENYLGETYAFLNYAFQNFNLLKKRIFYKKLTEKQKQYYNKNFKNIKSINDMIHACKYIYSILMNYDLNNLNDDQKKKLYSFIKIEIFSYFNKTLREWNTLPLNKQINYLNKIDKNIKNILYYATLPKKFIYLKNFCDKYKIIYKTKINI